MPDNRHLGEALLAQQFDHRIGMPGLVVGDAAALFERHTTDRLAQAVFVHFARPGEVPVVDGLPVVEVGVDDGFVDDEADGHRGVIDRVRHHPVDG